MLRAASAMSCTRLPLRVIRSRIWKSIPSRFAFSRSSALASNIDVLFASTASAIAMSAVFFISAVAVAK